MIDFDFSFGLILDKNGVSRFFPKLQVKDGALNDIWARHFP